MNLPWDDVRLSWFPRGERFSGAMEKRRAPGSGVRTAAVLAALLLLPPAPGRGETKLTGRQLVHNLKSKTYTGERVDLKFDDSRLPEILAKFESISGLKLNIRPALKSRPGRNMRYNFMGIPWDNALSSILSGNGLDLRLEGEELWVDVYRPEKDNTVSAFLVGIVTAAAALGGAVWGLSRRRRRRRNLERERKITLSPEAVEELVRRLDFLFQVDKIHRNGRLSLDSLAERLGVQPYQLSGIVNGRMGKSFTDLVSDYRIEEVKKRLSDPGESANILNIAYDAGFGTKASFNRIFKERTGQTPREFKKKKTNSH